MKRKNQRELLIKMFYEMEMNKDFGNQIYKSFLENNSINNLEDKYFYSLYELYIKNKEAIDESIKSLISLSWDMSRIAKVDLSILRVAVTEIVHMEDIPYKVSINEAINLAKDYGDESSYKFINGILGNLMKQIQ
ncbi:N utilization substance protein B [Acetoanaerobium pronyense]|uniref:Transcription antitermination protein NusB n=1 Tax=Acetoanaerobium pronyense TaxID=1482736 RepID=A0ABS4KIH6_9FIRM|nr:transcription antitermination factor NusB [Acetoanaerobium pronyense]MBP2027587.1 N utilization substance protein B [Acetoanaerobium pronyense]